MATYRLSAKLLSRSSGRSATAAAAYRAGERIVDERTREAFDYRRRSDVLDREILAPTSAPDWVHDRHQLWNAVECAEHRKDAQVAREIQVSLPHELSLDDNRTLLHSFVQKQFIERGMVADVAIHAAHRGSDDRNVHAHILLTTRELRTEGFGKKVRDWNERALLESFRMEWEIGVNQALERANVQARVDHRSYADRGIDLEPEPKQGPVASEMERYGRRSRAGDDRRAAKARNAERKRLHDAREQNTREVRDEEMRRDAEAQRNAEREKHRDKERAGKARADANSRRNEHTERTGREETGPTIGQPDAPNWQLRREEVLSEAYERDMRGSALARFWRIERTRYGLAFENARGRFEDRGTLITARDGNDLEIRGMLDLASVKGWTELCFTGSDAFKRQGMAAALERGFTIRVDDRDAKLLRDVELSLARDKAKDPHVTRDHASRATRERDNEEWER